MYIYIFETLLYLSYAFTGGYLLLQFVPESAKPQIKVPFNLFHYSLLAIPLFSFMTILRMVFILRDFAESMPFHEVLLIVLTDYDFGNAWIWNLILCTVMFIISQLANMQNKYVKWALAIAWCCSVLAHGWASHPAAFASWGFLAQSIHVAAVSIWLGVLIIAAWFTRGSWRWKAFVKWFTPLAIGSMLLIVAAGIGMMVILVDGYLNSWGIRYGEALLLKHLVFIPLLLLAFMNGFLTRRSDQGRNEQTLQWWLRAETVLALAILILTAYMGMQEPPHEGEFSPPSPSPLFTYLHGQAAELSLEWHWSLSSISLMLLGILTLGLLPACYAKGKKLLFMFLAAVTVAFPFFGLLLAVH